MHSKEAIFFNVFESFASVLNFLHLLSVYYSIFFSMVVYHFANLCTYKLCLTVHHLCLQSDFILQEDT